MRTPHAFSLPLAFLALSTPALASSPDGAVPSISVDISDLDLTTESGASRLESRLKTLINRMCVTSDRSGEAKKLERACRKTALAHAEPQARFAIRQARVNAIRLASNSPKAAAPAIRANPEG